MSLLVPLLVGGALLGANVAKNKDENILEGALKGALLGGGASTLGGALGFGNNATISDAALKKMIAETQVGQAGKVVTDVASASGPSFMGFGETVARETPEKWIAMRDAAAGNETKILSDEVVKDKVAPNFFERTGAKILATAKDKPLETAYFASSVGSALSPQGQTMQTVPYQPGSVQQTPSVEQSINQNFGDQPQFIPRPLFEDMQGRSLEEMLLLQDQMMARGLV